MEGFRDEEKQCFVLPEVWMQFMSFLLSLSPQEGFVIPDAESEEQEEF